MGVWGGKLRFSMTLVWWPYYLGRTAGGARMVQGNMVNDATSSSSIDENSDPFSMTKGLLQRIPCFVKI